MNAMLKLVVRGALVLMIAGGAVACSDDTDDNVEEGTGGTMDGEITPAICEDMTSSQLPASCKTCTCAELPEEMAACDDACVALVLCTGTKCAGIDSDAERTACAIANCQTEVGATGDLGMATTAAGPAFLACTTECGFGAMTEDGGM